MEITLLVVIVLQFAYIIYSDFQNRLERERLGIKAMSKDLDDYRDALNDKEEEEKEEEVITYVNLDEVSNEQLIKSKEK